MLNPLFFLFMQMSTKEAIAQDLFTLMHYTSVRFCLIGSEGLKSIGALKLIQAFPNEILPMFTFQGQHIADDVMEAVDMKVSEDSEGLRPEDEVLLRFLQRYIHTYIRSLTQSGMSFFLVIVFILLLWHIIYS